MHSWAANPVGAAHPDYGTANTLFKLDNTYIELLAADGDGMAADIVNGILDDRGPCLGGLVFGTEDAQTFIAHARSAGLPASDPMPGHGKDEQTGAERRWHNIFWDPAAARGIFSFCIQHDAGSTLPDATPTAGEPISGVDHVVVKTRSVEAAKRFYGEQLGIRLALEQHVPEWGGTQLFFERVPCRLRSLHRRKPPNKTSCGDWRLRQTTLRPLMSGWCHPVSLFQKFATVVKQVRGCARPNPIRWGCQRY